MDEEHCSSILKWFICALILTLLIKAKIYAKIILPIDVTIRNKADFIVLFSVDFTSPRLNEKLYRLIR